jgi:PAS domain S-box-containing protein
MSSHLHEDHAERTPDPGAVDELISQARKLRGQVDAVRRDGLPADEDGADARWQRALCELAVRQLDDLGEHLGQLRDHLHDDTSAHPAGGPPEPVAYPSEPGRSGQGGQAGTNGAGGADGTRTAVRAGSAQWNLLTDAVEWSEELYRIFGRTRHDGPLTLDELPSWLFEEDQRSLTEMVTGCLVDGRPINGEFRIVRPDGAVRTVHMTGEPVLDGAGNTASMWAVLRDVSELRRTQRMLRETRVPRVRPRPDAAAPHREPADARERPRHAGPRQAEPPWWRGPLRFPSGAPVGLEVAAGYLPARAGAPEGGDWYDAMRLPDADTLLAVGDLTGHGVAASTQLAMLLGALRGLALAAVEPPVLLARLNDLLDTAERPALGSALCCRYRPQGRVLTWSQAGHPAPVLYRDGIGRVLDRPEGVLLGATAGAEYGRRAERLRPGDVLVLHTDGLLPRSAAAADDPSRVVPLLALGPWFAGGRGAQECLRALVGELGGAQREHDACVLLARVE